MMPPGLPTPPTCIYSSPSTPLPFGIRDFLLTRSPCAFSSPNLHKTNSPADLCVRACQMRLRPLPRTSFCLFQNLKRHKMSTRQARETKLFFSLFFLAVQFNGCGHQIGAGLHPRRPKKTGTCWRTSGINQTRSARSHTRRSLT